MPLAENGYTETVICWISHKSRIWHRTFPSESRILFYCLKKKEEGEVLEGGKELKERNKIKGDKYILDSKYVVNKYF